MDLPLRLDLAGVPFRDLAGDRAGRVAGPLRLDLAGVLFRDRVADRVAADRVPERVADRVPERVADRVPGPFVRRRCLGLSSTELTLPVRSMTFELLETRLTTLLAMQFGRDFFLTGPMNFTGLADRHPARRPTPSRKKGGRRRKIEKVRYA